MREQDVKAVKLIEDTYFRAKPFEFVVSPGRLDSGTAPALARELESLTQEGKYRIVVDVSNVAFMSSAGLRVLINTQRNCRRYGRGNLILTDPPETIYEALDSAGFLQEGRDQIKVFYSSKEQ